MIIATHLRCCICGEHLHPSDMASSGEDDCTQIGKPLGGSWCIPTFDPPLNLPQKEYDLWASTPNLTDLTRNLTSQIKTPQANVVDDPDDDFLNHITNAVLTEFRNMAMEENLTDAVDKYMAEMSLSVNSRKKQIEACPGTPLEMDFLATLPVAPSSPPMSWNQLCKFCMNNGELPAIYKSHVLKDFRGRVKCPILQNHVCDICGATGARAHTRKYCPQRLQEGQNLTSVPLFRILKNGQPTMTRNHKPIRSNQLCKFCMKNGELPIIYKSHALKDFRGMVQCPILRRHVCDICGATGERGHTRKYCPELVHEDQDQMPRFRVLTNGRRTMYLNHK